MIGTIIMNMKITREIIYKIFIHGFFVSILFSPWLSCTNGGFNVESIPNEAIDANDAIPILVWKMANGPKLV